MMQFKDKICVVTGASKGIGAAIAAAYIEAGAKGVALFGRGEAAVKEMALSLDPTGERTLGVKCDVGDEASVQAAFAEVYAKFGRVDVLVNNAGFTKDSLFHKMTTEQFIDVMNVHVNGTFYCTKQVIAGMREQGYGRIVNMSSMSAYGNPGQANYSAAKAGIMGMTKTLAMEVASKGITVNCVAPGLTNTDIVSSIPDKVMEALINAIPMKRIAEVKEISDIVLFLTSEECSYVSGQCIDAAGGQ